MDPIKEAPAGANAELTAENERVNQIMALATEHGMLDKAQGWISSKATVAAVSREINQSYKEKLKALPPADVTATPGTRVGAERETQKPWASFGEQLVAVAAAMTPGGKSDMRLFAAATGMNQAVPSEGGFAVAPAVRHEHLGRLNNSADSLLGMTDQYTVEGESLTFNANAETSRRPAPVRRGPGLLDQRGRPDHQVEAEVPRGEGRAQGARGPVYVTDKLLRNAPALESVRRPKAAGDEINFLVGDAIVNGTASDSRRACSRPARSSRSTRRRRRRTGPSSRPMRTRCGPGCTRGFARERMWLMNVDVEPTLDDFNTPIKNVAGTENVGGFGSNIYNAEKNTLKGRPIIFVEYCQSLGTLGDVILTDPKAYATGTGRRGSSTRCRCTSGSSTRRTAFRFMFAVDGQSWLNAAITPFKGTNTLSNIVVLQAR
jgi:hypothetical protein